MANTVTTSSVAQISSPFSSFRPLLITGKLLGYLPCSCRMPGDPFYTLNETVVGVSPSLVYRVFLLMIVAAITIFSVISTIQLVKYDPALQNSVNSISTTVSHIFSSVTIFIQSLLFFYKRSKVLNFLKMWNQLLKNEWFLFMKNDWFLRYVFWLWLTIWMLDAITYLIWYILIGYTIERTILSIFLDMSRTIIEMYPMVFFTYSCRLITLGYAGIKQTGFCEANNCNVLLNLTKSEKMLEKLVNSMQDIFQLPLLVWLFLKALQSCVFAYLVCFVFSVDMLLSITLLFLQIVIVTFVADRLSVQVSQVFNKITVRDTILLLIKTELL